MTERAAYSQSEWASRRRAQADRARGGGTAAIGVLLAVFGVALGTVLALKRDVLEGAAIVVTSAMVGSPSSAAQRGAPCMLLCRSRMTVARTPCVRSPGASGPALSSPSGGS